MDFHHFFPDAPHALLYERHRGMILNPDLRQLADLVVAAMPGGVGMPLGVEPSQQEMVALPSSLDNRIKAKLSIHGAAHYMDDYYTILPSKQAAEVTAADVIGMRRPWACRSTPESQKWFRSPDRSGSAKQSFR